MSLRIILVPLFDVDADDTALTATFTIAQRFDAHVVSLFVRPDLRSAVPVSGAGGARTVTGDPGMHVIEAEIVRRRDNARARFEAARAAAGVPCADARPGLGSNSTQWREVGGRYEEGILGERAWPTLWRSAATEVLPTRSMFAAWRLRPRSWKAAGRCYWRREPHGSASATR